MNTDELSPEELAVQFCINDRPKVVRMWNEIGVKCLAVGNQFIEF